MKNILIIAGAAAFAAAAPATAQPGHAKGHGKSAQAKGHKSTGQMYGYGRGGCPPGLRKKNNGCMPPGQYKKMYNVGQRYNRDYGNLWSYNQIPYDLRQQYGFDQRSRYYYGDGYLYRVDPRSQVVQQVVNAILR